MTKSEQLALFFAVCLSGASGQAWAQQHLLLSPGLEKQPAGRAQQPVTTPLPSGTTTAVQHSGTRPPRPNPNHNGEYSDSFIPLNDQVREFERDPANGYTYCIRATATYECLSYGTDGEIRRQQSRSVSHGTGFAYRELAGETLLLTNAHVVNWPSVTDARSTVADIPAGCKLIVETLQIVDNENDDFNSDDISLTRVAVDDELDSAIVKTKAKLRLIPYRIGKSSALKFGDVVMVRGFPLGAFQAYNTGKVVNPYDVDTFKDWNHIDFIIDASLSSGNSGSPVLALSQRTGEYELVGVFHASYARANSLNAVIGIDQVRDFMLLQKRSSTALSGDRSRGTIRRADVETALGDSGFVPYFALGPLSVSLRTEGKSFLFEVFSRRFPLDDHRVAILLDQPSADGTGGLSRVWLGSERGYKMQDLTALGEFEQKRLQAVLLRLHTIAAATVRYRALLRKSNTAREVQSERTTLQRMLARDASGDQELSQSLLEMADRLGPHPADSPAPYSSVLAELGTSRGATEGALAKGPAPAPRVDCAPLPPGLAPPPPGAVSGSVSGSVSGAVSAPAPAPALQAAPPAPPAAAPGAAAAQVPSPTASKPVPAPAAKATPSLPAAKPAPGKAAPRAAASPPAAKR